MPVPPERAEEARAAMLELFPGGFEEATGPGGLELVVYTEAAGEARIRHAFADTRSLPVAEGWEERWREFHRPVRAGRLWIGPPWERPPAKAVAVVVDPGRAFGTGGHATTRLCLELLAALPPGSLLDLGCGSGVLALAAAKLGHAPVTALDRDPAAVEATQRNAAANGVDMEVRLADVLRDELPAAELVLANLTLKGVEAVLARVDCARAVVSGYLVSEVPEAPRFRRRTRLENEGWAADALERTE